MEHQLGHRGSLGLRIYRPVAGNFLVLAEDGPRTLTPATLSTFPVSIPVLAGDLVGLASSPLMSNCVFQTESPADKLLYRTPPSPVGSTIEFREFEAGVRLNVSAALLPPPAIAAFSPKGGSIKGAKVTISGANFASVSAVSFGGVPAKGFTVDSETQITATAPASKKLAKIKVAVTTVAGVATSAARYAYEGCRIPNLVGKKLKPSRKQAKEAGCKVGKIAKVEGASGKTGKVAKQGPKPGRILVPGTKINVTLAP